MFWDLLASPSARGALFGTRVNNEQSCRVCWQMLQIEWSVVGASSSDVVEKTFHQVGERSRGGGVERVVKGLGV